MWIILIKKLPTEVSPPKLSIFWSTPWPGPTFRGKGLSALREKRKSGSKKKVDPEFGIPQICVNCGEPIHYRVSGGEEQAFCGCDGNPQPATEKDTAIAYNEFGAEPNWPYARRIHYKDRDIRVFPHEFTPVTAENMRLYITGDSQSGPSHEFVPDSVASEREINAILDGETKPIYEMAMNEGATPAQAMLVAMGQDITLEDVEFPPATGWYRPFRWAAEVFCEEWEMTE